MNQNKLIVHCDGCRKKDGRGGWGVVIQSQERIRCIGMGFEDTTNNRMEIMGVLFALQLLGSENEKEFKFHSDSQYVVNGYNQWMHRWRQKGWRKISSGDIKNLGLWKDLYLAWESTKARGKWVRGHMGDDYNELADSIANHACKIQDSVNQEFKSIQEANCYFV